MSLSRGKSWGRGHGHKTGRDPFSWDVTHLQQTRFFGPRLLQAPVACPPFGETIANPVPIQAIDEGSDAGRYGKF